MRERERIERELSYVTVEGGPHCFLAWQQDVAAGVSNCFTSPEVRGRVGVWRAQGGSAHGAHVVTWPAMQTCVLWCSLKQEVITWDSITPAIVICGSHAPAARHLTTQSTALFLEWPMISRAALDWICERGELLEPVERQFCWEDYVGAVVLVSSAFLFLLLCFYGGEKMQSNSNCTGSPLNDKQHLIKQERKGIN